MAVTAEFSSIDTKDILEVTRNLNLEKLLLCYKYTIIVACLKVIRILQKFGHLPSNPHLSTLSTQHLFNITFYKRFVYDLISA